MPATKKKKVVRKSEPDEKSPELNEQLGKLVGLMERFDERLTAIEAKNQSSKRRSVEMEREPQFDIPAPETRDGVVFKSPWFNFKQRLSKARYVPTGPDGSYRIDSPMFAEFENQVCFLAWGDKVENPVIWPKDHKPGDPVEKIEVMRAIVEDMGRKGQRPNFVELKEGEKLEYSSRRARAPMPEAVGEWESPLAGELPGVPPPPEARDTLERQKMAAEGERGLK